MTRAPVHVVHLIAGLRRAGAETALTRLVRHSDPARVRHTVVSLTDRGALAGEIEAAGGTVIALGMRGPASAPLGVARLLGTVRDLEPNVLQGWMAHGNLLAWLARVLAAPTSRLAWNLRLTARDLGHERRLTRALTRAAGLASRSVDLMISNSHAALSDHARLGYRPRATRMIPNGFDLDAFHPDAEARRRARAALGVGEDAVAFGLVGRFHPQKGHAYFVEAAGRVASRHPEAVFVLAGAGTDRSAELDAMIEATGAVHAFRRLGERDDVAEVMRALDVACTPSLYEGFPNVVGEAMATALPCVVADVSDVGAILGDAGLVIPPGDATGLEQAMSRMVEIGAAGRAAIGATGRRRAAEHYSIQIVCARYQEAYLALAAAAAGGEPIGVAA